jgi:hypothetical protein
MNLVERVVGVRMGALSLTATANANVSVWEVSGAEALVFVVRAQWYETSHTDVHQKKDAHLHWDLTAV